MMFARNFICAALLLGLITAISDLAAAQKAETEPETDATPNLAPLMVGAPQIASDANLSIEDIRVDIGAERGAYRYRLRTKGAASLSLFASISLPTLKNNRDEIYELPSTNFENPIQLTVKSDEKSLATMPYVRAEVLGVDRLSELKTEHIPPIPFSEEVEKALRNAKPDTLAKVAALGLISPFDPEKPDQARETDWSLDVTHGWTQKIDSGKAISLEVSFAPIKARYTVDRTTISKFADDVKDVCFPTNMAAAFKAMFKTKGATVFLDDIRVSTETPMPWLDSAAPTISVHKPKATSIVAFCGEDEASAGQLIVKGKIPEDDTTNEIRVLIFTPS